MKTVPVRKMSKKAQKEYHDRQRGSWKGVNPVSRAVPSGKVYNRKRLKKSRPGDED